MHDDGDDERQPDAAIVPANARANALATSDAALADPETLVEALEYLRERIPGFVVLPVRERRSMGNAAHLDPELVEVGKAIYARTRRKSRKASKEKEGAGE